MVSKYAKFRGSFIFATVRLIPKWIWFVQLVYLSLNQYDGQLGHFELRDALKELY